LKTSSSGQVIGGTLRLLRSIGRAGEDALLMQMFPMAAVRFQTRAFSDPLSLGFSLPVFLLSRFF